MQISAVCPYWNRPNVIQRCVSSVLAQTFRDFELIIVDDGSATPLQMEHVSTDIPLRIIRHSENLGPASARNTGARAARGEWLAFIDCDDEWLPAKLERQLAFAHAHSNSAKLQAFATGFDFIDHFSGRRLRRTPRSLGSVYEFSAACGHCPGSTLMIQRNLFFQIGAFDERLTRLEDYEFFIRFGLAGGVLSVVPECLSRIHVEGSPDIARVVSSASYIAGTYRALTSLPWQIRRNIASYCRLARASSYMRNNQKLTAMWNFIASVALVPRGSIQIGERFEEDRNRSRQLRH